MLRSYFALIILSYKNNNRRENQFEYTSTTEIAHERGTRVVSTIQNLVMQSIKGILYCIHFQFILQRKFNLYFIINRLTVGSTRIIGQVYAIQNVAISWIYVFGFSNTFSRRTFCYNVVESLVPVFAVTS